MDVCCECCVLSGRGLCDELITRPEESFQLWCVIMCDLETTRMKGSWPTGGGGRGVVVASNKNKVCMWEVGVVLWPLFITREEAAGTRQTRRSGDSRSVFTSWQIYKKKAYSSNNPKKGVEIPIEKLAITYWSTQCHIPEAWNLRQNLCDSHEFRREILGPVDSRNPIIPECGSFRLKCVLTGFKIPVWNDSKIPLVTKFMDLKIKWGLQNKRIKTSTAIHTTSFTKLWRRVLRTGQVYISPAQNLSARYRWVVTLTFQPLYLLGITSYHYRPGRWHEKKKY